MADQTTITITTLSARMLARVLRDPRVRAVALEDYDYGKLDDVLRQLPEPDATEDER